MAHQKRLERSSTTPSSSERSNQHHCHSPFTHGRPLDMANLTANESTSIRPSTRSGSPPLHQLDTATPSDHVSCDEATPVPRSDNVTTTSEGLQQQFGIFNDHSSLFEQVSRIDCQFDQLSIVGDNPILDDQDIQHQHTRTNRSAKREGVSTSSTTLKEQEKTIDILKKENFGLKLKIYNLEKRLDELSPDHMDDALKENVDLKVHISILTQELKKYKKMLLDLNHAMDILQQQLDTTTAAATPSCDLQHGMSAEEKADYDAIVAKCHRQEQENQRLHRMLSELSSENARLRASRGGSMGGYGGLSGKLGRSSSYNNINNVSDTEMDVWSTHHRRRRLTSGAESCSSSSSSRYNTTTATTTLKDASFQHERQAISYKELRQTLNQVQERNAEMASQLVSKNKELDQMYRDLDVMSTSLHETRQQLRDKTNECQALKRELAMIEERRERIPTKDISELLNTISNLRREKDDLDLIVRELRQELDGNTFSHQNEIIKLEKEIDSREEEFIKLEEQVLKVVEGAERLEAREKEKDLVISELRRKLEHTGRHRKEDSMDEIQRLRQDIIIKETQIAEHREQLEDERLCKNDIDELEQQLTKMRQDVKQKEACIQELEAELDYVTEGLNEARARYEDDLKDLERQVTEIEREIRERDVRIASLEGHLEAQADATQRERNIHAEEIKDLEDKIHSLGDTLREKELMLSSMQVQHQQQMVTEEDYEHDLAAVKKHMGARLIQAEEDWEKKITALETKLTMAENKLKNERRISKERISEALYAKRTLQQKLHAASKKNELLNELLDQYKANIEHGSWTQAYHVVNQLNKELQQELEDRDRDLERETCRLQNIQEAHAKLSEEKEQLEDLLARRNSIITHLFERLENTQERKAVMESVLLRQATEEMDTSIYMRSDSGLSSG